MAWDFPASPTDGATYTPAGGPTYTYTSGIWRVLPTPQTALSSKSIGDTPPLNPIHGQSWWNSTDGFSYIYYVDPGGAPGQWVQESDTSLPDAPSDGNFYVRSGGTWVQVPRYQTLSMAGGRQFDITVPANARKCRLTGFIMPTTNNSFFTMVQLSVAAGVFRNTAGDYALGGFLHQAAVATPGIIPISNNLTIPGMMLAQANDNKDFPVTFDGLLTLNRIKTTAVFVLVSRGSSIGGSAGTSQNFYQTYLGVGVTGPSLTVLALRFTSSITDPWDTGSHVDIEWM